MKRPSLRTVLVTSWRVLSTAVVITLGISLLLFSRLETLLPGYADIEVKTAQSSHSLSAIISNPVNAPYKLTVYGVAKIIGDPLLATRVTSAIFGSLSMVLFYYIIRRVHSQRIAFLASVVFACSAWFLHAARLGTPDIMLTFSVLLLALAGYWLIQKSSHSYYYIFAILALGLSIYVPGMAWIVLAGLAIRRTKDIAILRHRISKWQLAGMTLLLAALVIAPITWAVMQNPSIALTLFGLPTSTPNMVDFSKNLLNIPLSLFIASPENPVVWLGNLPLLDIAMSALLILGVYYYFKFRQLDRAKFLAVFIIWASILIALESGVANTILLPAVYIGIAGGIALLITQWFTVFPRNPLAQSIGVIAVALIIGTSVIYNLRAYFVAWPYWQPTKAAYTQTEANLIQ